MEKEIINVGTVYENHLTPGICGIVYKKEVSDKIREISEKYLEKAKSLMLADIENVSVYPGGYWHCFLFGAHVHLYVGEELNKKLNELKRPFRKEVKDTIMHSADACYTYNWTMSQYNKPTYPVYINYTNPYDQEGYGAWRPLVLQRLKYIEQVAKKENKGDNHLFKFSNPSCTVKEIIESLTPANPDEYTDFYMCSNADAHKLAEELYAAKMEKSA